LSEHETWVIRCNVCGERSTVTNGSTEAAPDEEVDPELAVMQTIGGLLSRLRDRDARMRVLRWACDRFQVTESLTGQAAEAVRRATVNERDSDLTMRDPDLTMEGVELFYEPVEESTAHQLEGDSTERLFDEQPTAPVEAAATPSDTSVAAGAAGPGDAGLESMVRGFVNDFQQVAQEWQRA
jgi:hypothetical protein